MPDPSILVLSDAHLGDRHSWLHSPKVQDGVISAIEADESVDTLVFLGDTLDLNYGTMTAAIEGICDDAYPGYRPGWRALLEGICARTKVEKIVYVPGNHDYMMWEWQARRQNTLTPLGKGQLLGGEVMSRGVLPDHFLRGVLPEGCQGRLLVRYPDYTAQVGGHRVVLAHGHHLDKRQTEGIALREVADGEDPERFRRRLELAVAQYQAFAHLISIRRASRRLVRRVLGKVGAWLAILSSFRGHKPSTETLSNIRIYLQYLAEVPDASAFVFGHTHEPGGWNRRGAPGRFESCPPVYNCGSFVPPRRERASMLLLSPSGDGPTVDLIRFERSGEYAKARPIE